jgi:quercetin dioxygenase-like cupin family protein
MFASGKAFFAGLIVGATIVAVVVGPRAVAADRAAQTARAKYAITIALENDRVRVRDVTFPPGVPDTGMHTHEYPHVGVILTAGSLTFTEPGKPTETTKFETGSVGYREAHVTHQAANPGKTPMRVIEVELK